MVKTIFIVSFGYVFTYLGRWRRIWSLFKLTVPSVSGTWVTNSQLHYGCPKPVGDFLNMPTTHQVPGTQRLCGLRIAWQLVDSLYALIAPCLLGPFTFILVFQQFLDPANLLPTIILFLGACSQKRKSIQGLSTGRLISVLNPFTQQWELGIWAFCFLRVSYSLILQTLIIIICSPCASILWHDMLHSRGNHSNMGESQPGNLRCFITGGGGEIYYMMPLHAT